MSQTGDILSYNALPDRSQPSLRTWVGFSKRVSCEVSSLPVLVTLEKPEFTPIPETHIISSWNGGMVKLRQASDIDKEEPKLEPNIVLIEANSQSRSILSRDVKLAKSLIRELKPKLEPITESPPFRMPAVKHFWKLAASQDHTPGMTRILVGAYDLSSTDQLMLFETDPKAPQNLLEKQSVPLEVIDICISSDLVFIAGRISGSKPDSWVRIYTTLEGTIRFLGSIQGVHPTLREWFHSSGNSRFGRIFVQTSKSITLHCYNNQIVSLKKNKEVLSDMPTSVGVFDPDGQKELVNGLTGHKDKLYVAKILNMEKQVIHIFKETGETEFRNLRVVEFPGSAVSVGLWVSEFSMICGHVETQIASPREGVTVHFSKYSGSENDGSPDNPLLTYKEPSIRLLVEEAAKKMVSSKDQLKTFHRLNLVSFAVMQEDLTPKSHVHIHSSGYRADISAVHFHKVKPSFEIVFMVPHFTPGELYYSIHGELVSIQKKISFRPGARYGVQTLQDLNLTTEEPKGQNNSPANLELTYMINGDYYQHSLMKLTFTN